MPTRPTDDAAWADGASAAITEPTASKRSAGWLAAEKPPHQYFNWFWNLLGRWVRFLDQSLYQEAGEGGQHKADGTHYEMTVSGGSGNVKATLYGINGEASTTNNLASYDKVGGTKTFFVTAAGDAQGRSVTVTEGAIRYAIQAGKAGELISAGTRGEPGAGTPGMGYSDADSTSRTIRYHSPFLPYHAELYGVAVIYNMGNTANSMDADLYAADSSTADAATASGSITTVTGVTGVGSARIAVGVSPAGEEGGWWLDVTVNNGGAAGYAKVAKVIWSYIPGKL